jgi:hypothetical protein
MFNRYGVTNKIQIDVIKNLTNSNTHNAGCTKDKSEKLKIRRPVCNQGRSKERDCWASARGANL